MKTKRIALCAVLAACCLSCSKEHGDAGEGSVRFTVADTDGALVEKTRSNVSDYTSLPSAADFSIVVKDADKTEVYSGLISGWDASTALQAGSYSVTASYGAEGTEGFDKPFFTGSTDFTVLGGETTQVSIPVALGNMLVKVAVSESFANYYSSYEFKITTGNGTEIAFPKGETRAAFIDAYRFTISGTLVSQGGQSSSFSKEYTGTLEAKTCYTISFDASNIGGNTVTVSFNGNLTPVELGDVELNQ